MPPWKPSPVPWITEEDIRGILEDTHEHSLMDFPASMILPGFVIPQDTNVPKGSFDPKNPNKTIVRLFKDGKIGVRLVDILKSEDPSQLYDAVSSDAEIPILPMYIHWPGYRNGEGSRYLAELYKYLPSEPRPPTAGHPVSTVPALVKAAANIVEIFYKNVQYWGKDVVPNSEWSPHQIPFDQIYLLEVRRACLGHYQPVLSWKPW